MCSANVPAVFPSQSHSPWSTEESRVSILKKFSIIVDFTVSFQSLCPYNYLFRNVCHTRNILYSICNEENESELCVIALVTL